jgi:hypothetical protein
MKRSYRGWKPLLRLFVMKGSGFSARQGVAVASPIGVGNDKNLDAETCSA